MSADEEMELIELEEVLKSLRRQAKRFNSAFNVAKEFFIEDNARADIITTVLGSAVIISKRTIEEDELKKLVFDEFFEYYDNKETEEKVKKLFFKKKP